MRSLATGDRIPVRAVLPARPQRQGVHLRGRVPLHPWVLPQPALQGPSDPLPPHPGSCWASWLPHTRRGFFMTLFSISRKECCGFLSLPFSWQSVRILQYCSWIGAVATVLLSCCFVYISALREILINNSTSTEDKKSLDKMTREQKEARHRTDCVPLLQALAWTCSVCFLIRCVVYCCPAELLKNISSWPVVLTGTASPRGYTSRALTRKPWPNS